MHQTRSLAALFAAVLLGVFLAGCGPAGTRQSSTALDIVETLASPAFEGRVSGSEGNTRAADYIADYFQDQNLEPYFETYAQEYQGPVYQPEQASAQVTLTSAGGETIALEAGTDFLCMLPRTDITLELPVFSDPEACREGAGIYFAPDRLSCIDWLNENPDSAAVFCDAVRSGETSAIYTNEHTLLILDHAFSPYLAEGATLSFQVNASHSGGTVQNVVAVRRGSEGKNALVFCAHFDGSGILGDQLFPSALDNASGVAVVLRIAALVQEQAPQLKNDLIFAAFNSEEVGMSGSQAFAAAVAGQYDTVSLINIDCVGLKDEPVLLAAEQNGRKLWEALGQLPFASDIRPGNASYTSDQIVFNRYPNCVPVVFGNVHAYLASGHAHTPLDQPGQLDGAILEDLAARLADFAAEHGDESFAASPLQTTESEEENASEKFWDEMQALRVQVTREYGLAYNQALCVTAETPLPNGKTSAQNYLLYGMQFFASPDTLAGQFSFLTLPGSLGDYAFSRAAVRMDRSAEESTTYRSTQDRQPDQYVPGEIYTFGIDPEKLEILSAEYLAPDGSALLLAYSKGQDTMMITDPIARGEDLDAALAGWEMLGYQPEDLYYAAKYRQDGDVLLVLFEESPGEESSDPTLISPGRMAPLSPGEITARLTRIDLEGLVQTLFESAG